MTMNLRRARQIIKQRHHTSTLVLKILEAGPTDDRSLFEVLRKRGWKEGQGMLREMVAANNIMNESAPEMRVWVDECTEDQKENDMDLSKLTPDQMLEMAAQMQKMAEAKKRELDPELLRQLLESGQSVLDAADLLAETTERFRRAMNAVREARGLPTTKKA